MGLNEQHKFWNKSNEKGLGFFCPFFRPVRDEKSKCFCLGPGGKHTRLHCHALLLYLRGMHTHPKFLVCLAAVLLLAGCGPSSQKLVQKGQAALENKQPQAAAAAFEKAARRVTRDPALYYNLASARLALGEKKNAMDAVDNGLAVAPGNTRLLQLKASIAHMNGDWPAARDALRDAAENGAPEPYILNARATVERMEKNYDRARLLLLAALRLDPAHPAANYNLASLYIDHYAQDKLLPQARDLLEMCLLKGQLPDDQAQNAANRLARINKNLEREDFRPPANTSLSTQRLAEAARYAAAGNWASALRAYNDAINADPLSLDARLALAAFHEARNNAAAAGAAYIEAASKLPNATSDVLFKAAEAALAQNRPLELAAEFSSRGLARAPNNYRFYYQLAVVRARQNRRDDARAFAGQCARLAPEPFASQVAAWAESL